jgi:hypothetical protein
VSNWIKVGKEFVNLDNVLHAKLQPKTEDVPGAVGLYFFAEGGREYGLCFTGEEQEAVEAYLTGQAVDVVQIHRAVLKERQDAADRFAASQARLALQEQCTDPRGHEWAWTSEDDPFILCLRYGVCARSPTIGRAIECWGGVEALP